jgi:hypothetical protein
MTTTTHPHTLTTYPGRHLDIASLVLTRCTDCGRYEVGVPLGACAVCGGRRRLAAIGELFEGDDGGGGNEINQDASGTEPTATDRHGAG